MASMKIRRHFRNAEAGFHHHLSVSILLKRCGREHMHAQDVADCIYALGCLTLALRPTLAWLKLCFFLSAAFKKIRFAVPKVRRISGPPPSPLET